MEEHDKLELLILSYEYKRNGEPELAEICRKSAMYLAEKKKSTTPMSAVQ